VPSLSQSDGPHPTPLDQILPDPAAARSRLPIRAAGVQDRLPVGTPWLVDTVTATPSTNTDLAAAALAGRAAGAVLIAEEQTAGKGRLGRQWTAPAGSGLTMSVLLRLPQVPLSRRGWVGVLLAVAVQRATAAEGLPATLKWPNDLLIDGRKCAGILAEIAGDAVVVGVGLNVTLTREELPRADATSLQLEGAADLDREVLAARILTELAVLLDRWSAAAGDVDVSGIRDSYLAVCSTIGASVRLELPGGNSLTGVAVGIDDEGGILVRGSDGTTGSYRAADVVHLRPAASH